LNGIEKTSFNWRWFLDVKGKYVKAISVEDCTTCDLPNPATQTIVPEDLVWSKECTNTSPTFNWKTFKRGA